MKGIQKLDEKWFTSSHFRFRDDGPCNPGAKTRQFSVFNKNYVLYGHVKWWTSWKQYCFFPVNPNYSYIELRQISEFCELVTKEHKNSLPNINRLKMLTKKRRQRRIEELASKKESFYHD